MEKLHKQLKFGLIGVTGGLTGLAVPAGLCGAACGNCLRCAGMGIMLVMMALLKLKGEKTHGAVNKCE